MGRKIFVGSRRARQHRRFGAALVTAAAVILPLVTVLGGVAQAAPTPPFTQCPAVGADASCELLIVINPDGSTTVTKDPGRGPFDQIEDTLIGVQNNSSHTVASLPISGSNIFGFDGDGLCNYIVCSWTHPTGYEGPNTSFTISNANNGVVNFTGGLAPGGSRYFSLEEHVTPGSIEFPVTVQAQPISGVEGASFSGTVATFNDSDAATDPKDVTANDSAVIDWGDGTMSAGTIVGPDASGNYTVSGTHTYAEEGTYTTTVSVTDPDDPGNPATASGTATIADAALSGTGASGVSGIEGQPISGATVATFTDANPGATTADFTATINWGDASTSAGTVSGPTGGPFNVSGSHTYADEGTYTVTVGITDAGGSTASATTTAKVADAALSATGRPNFVSTNPVSGIMATFTDANPGATTADFTASINWGDASTSTGTVSGPSGGPFSVSGSHTYAALGPYTITVTIVDDGGSTATATTHVIVYAFPAGGDFVVGDKGAATGKPVTFWSAQWSALNPLSGGSAPAAFKGFEDSAPTPTCGTAWATDPGNSVGPPGAVPSYMAVIVSGSISQSGSVISGNDVHMVIVKTNPGYAPNPGHPGTGTIVGVIC